MTTARSKRRPKVVKAIGESPFELERLRKCVTDLQALQALPVVWNGKDTEYILSRLLQTLVGTLGLDFAYARLWDGSVELVRVPLRREEEIDCARVGKALHSFVALFTATRSFHGPNPVGAGELSMRAIPLGLEEKMGVVIVGAQRPSFPSMLEMLLLRSAASLAVIALQDVRVRRQRDEFTEVFEREVTEQTREKAGLNLQLRQETLERERAQEEHARLAALVEHSPDFIVIASLAGQISFLNHGGQILLGLKEKTWKRRALADLMNPADRGQLTAVVLPRVREQGQWEGELNFRDFANGTVIPLLQYFFLIKKSAYGHQAIAGIGRDVTQRKKELLEHRHVEEALQKLRSELTHLGRVSMMGELSASIAHEINQPLGAIVNNGSVCLQVALKRGLPADVAEPLRDIVKDANRASSIVDRLRAMNKRATPEKSRVNIRDIVEEVLALAKRELVGRHTEVRQQLSAKLPAVLGDRIQLQQVFLNLVMNAIEAMGEIKASRRVLSIHGRRDELGGQEALRVTVEDRGKGIRPDDLDRIFEPFYTTKISGLGMGLRISRTIIESHGGRLWASSTERGSQFHCLLPVAAAKETAKRVGRGRTA